MKSRMWVVLAAAALILFLPVQIALGQDDGSTGSQTVQLTDHYTLIEGQRVDGDLLVIAQSITLQPGSVVTGNAALIGEDITVGGQIDGELTILGDNIILRANTTVNGNAHLCGDTIRRDSNVFVHGSYSSGCDQLGSVISSVAPLAFDPSRWTWSDVRLNPADWRWSELSQIDSPTRGVPVTTRLLGNLMLSLVFGALAGLYALICPLRLRRVSDALLGSPGTTLGIGLLSMVIAAAVTGLVIISLVVIIGFCLLPFLGLGWIALVLMIAMGWTALSLPVGAWLLARLEVRRVSPLAAASVGAVLLTFTTGLLTLNLWTAILYFLIMLGLTSWGLGAVVLTRFGGQIYPNPVDRHSRQKPKREEFAAEV